ncbi:MULTISPECIES: ribosome silencing factor [Candidatus Ichthyocystis]|uniref:Ribosomal silencing factor RsfS n=1 Tax=Candidatus Ichthyocystis hellenicum TaxID=1561003 RepID=A0A0S4M4A5_9BURK|nr:MULTISPECIES: ribosome silencing factor [Ichthyocystis]CUT17101.1 putative ribosome-associated protein [Candidatus Ichthyocystis hellenicum]
MDDLLHQLIINTLETHKAQDVVFLDTSSFSTIFDSMIVASVGNPRHVQALGRYLVEALRKDKYQIVGVEGEGDGNWILIDAGVTIIHIMLTEVREYYAIEELWNKSPGSSRK